MRKFEEMDERVTEKAARKRQIEVGRRNKGELGKFWEARSRERKRVRF